MSVTVWDDMELSILDALLSCGVVPVEDIASCVTESTVASAIQSARRLFRHDLIQADDNGWSLTRSGVIAAEAYRA